MSGLSPLLLWDYERGSAPYDVLCLVLLIIVFAVPPMWWGNPMSARP